MTTIENNRFNEVYNKVTVMYKKANEDGKDNLVKQLKGWLKTGTEKAKKDALQVFLSDINVY